MPLRFLSCFAAGVVLIVPAFARSEEAPPPITFRHATHAIGAAKEPTELASADQRFKLKVEGEPRKPIVRLYDAAGKPTGAGVPQAGHRVTALAISRDNKTFATAVGNFSNDWGKVRVWDAATGKEIAEYKAEPHLGEVFELKFSDDSKTLTITAAEAGGK